MAKELSSANNPAPLMLVNAPPEILPNRPEERSVFNILKQFCRETASGVDSRMYMREVFNINLPHSRKNFRFHIGNMIGRFGDDADHFRRIFAFDEFAGEINQLPEIVAADAELARA